MAVDQLFAAQPVTRIAEHRGRVVKTMGDGLLVEFASVVDAVTCAVAIQDGMAARNEGLAEDRRIMFRVGVHLGDVMVEDDDLYGDGGALIPVLEMSVLPTAAPTHILPDQ